MVLDTVCRQMRVDVLHVPLVLCRTPADVSFARQADHPTPLGLPVKTVQGLELRFTLHWSPVSAKPVHQAGLPTSLAQLASDVRRESTRPQGPHALLATPAGSLLRFTATPRPDVDHARLGATQLHRGLIVKTVLQAGMRWRAVLLPSERTMGRPLGVTCVATVTNRHKTRAAAVNVPRRRPVQTAPVHLARLDVPHRCRALNVRSAELADILSKVCSALHAGQDLNLTHSSRAVALVGTAFIRLTVPDVWAVGLELCRTTLRQQRIAQSVQQDASRTIAHRFASRVLRACTPALDPLHAFRVMLATRRILREAVAWSVHRAKRAVVRMGCAVAAALASRQMPIVQNVSNALAYAANMQTQNMIAAKCVRLARNRRNGVTRAWRACLDGTVTLVRIVQRAYQVMSQTPMDLRQDACGASMATQAKESDVSDALQTQRLRQSITAHLCQVGAVYAQPVIVAKTGVGFFLAKMWTSAQLALSKEFATQLPITQSLAVLDFRSVAT